MKKTLTLIFVCFLTLFESCTIPKDSRVLKRITKEWRDSKIVLYAWAVTPFYGVFLTLRNNGKFEHTSSGLMQSFEAGTWINSGDTLKLIYVDSKLNIKWKQNLIIDSQTSTLLFEGDSTLFKMRLKIMSNEIK